jgi:2-dehydro-3-deoxygalactonokinase
MSYTVFVDWGTTNFRAYLVARSGKVVASRSAAEGVKNATERHSDILRSHVQGWMDGYGIQAIACAGTIGSELGWHEVPMVAAPAGLRDVARGLHALSVPGLPPIWIIPGVYQRDIPERPGMMRGEEVILFGCLARLGVDAGLFCFPGTHSKWVTVGDGMVRDIQTVMTGECFELLRTGSVLARSLSGWSGVIADDWFARGIHTSAEVVNPLQSAFFVRALHVQGRLPTPDARASFLSGLLIGAEVRGMASDRPPGEKQVTIVAPARLARLYAQACGVFGIGCVEIDEEACFVAGARAVLDVHDAFVMPYARPPT